MAVDFYVENEEKTEKKFSRTKQLLTALIVFFVLIAALTALIIFRRYLPGKKFSNPPGTVGNTAGNLNNGGRFCEYNDVVYFSNPYDGGALYAMSPDESGIHYLSSSIPQNILAGGDYLYYFQTGVAGSGDFSSIAMGHGFHRSDLSGRHPRSMSSDVIVSGQLVNDYLYLVSVDKGGTKFYKLRCDQSEDPISLADYAINPSCAVDGTIYYNGTLNNHFLHALDTNGDTIRQILDTPLWFPAVIGDYVYYLDLESNYQLRRYRFSSGETEVLATDRVDWFNVGSGFIYYQTVGAAPQLKCMRTDGSDVMTVAEGNYNNIHMTSRYVYFQDFSDGTLYHSAIGSGSYSVFQAAADAVPSRK